MKNSLKILFVLFLLMFLLSNCAVVQPGEVGIKQKFGKLKGEPITSGIIGYNPFVAKVLKASARTSNLKLDLDLPSKEGLSVKSSISILYKLESAQFKNIITQYGLEYENIITAVFRSSASDICAQFFAKDMHSGKRADIEKAIMANMNNTLGGSGIIIEAVLMKSITLPPGLARSIEEKLQAEQDAMRMEFILLQEQSEADRKIIAAKGARDAQLITAKGTRDAQLIEADGLTEAILKLRTIEAFEKLSTSTGAKVIITDGTTNLLLNE